MNKTSGGGRRRSLIMANQWISRIEEYLWPEGFRRNVWMIVDAARDRQVLPIMRELHLEYCCLYSGPIPPALESVAPYLVQLDYDDKEAHRFLEYAWGGSRGVFLKCGAHRNTLRAHLRRILTVRGPAGNRLVFRYYDPRILRVYLPSCVEDELRSVFGPIECFWMEDGNGPEEILEFRLGRGELQQARLPLATGAWQRSGLNAPADTGRVATEEMHPSGMLAIRKEQMALFVASEIEKFENRVIAHLRKHFPRKCDALGESKIRRIIQHGIKQAASYDIRAERDVCKYIDLMFAFGRNFDKDTMLLWPAAILNDRTILDSKMKMERLFEAAMQHVYRGHRVRHA
jgi:hypothetical protein